MSLLDDLTPTTDVPLNGVRNSASQWQVDQTARIERARALAEARAQALECASRVFTGQPGMDPVGRVLPVADRYLEWLLRPEPDQP